MLEELDKLLQMISTFNNDYSKENFNWSQATNFVSCENSEEFFLELRAAYTTIKNWQEKEKQSRAKEYHLETKMLRYSLLEKEIHVLKQKLRFNAEPSTNTLLGYAKANKQGSDQVATNVKQSTISDHFASHHISKSGLNNLSADDNVLSESNIDLNLANRDPNFSITDQILKKHNIKELRQKYSSKNPFLTQSNYPAKDENTAIINLLQGPNGLTGLGNLTSALYNDPSTTVPPNPKTPVLAEAAKNLPKNDLGPKGGKRKSQPASRGDRAKNAAQKRMLKENEPEFIDECVEIVGIESFMNLVKKESKKENQPEKGSKEGKRSKKGGRGEGFDAEMVGIEDTPGKSRKRLKNK